MSVATSDKSNQVPHFLNGDWREQIRLLFYTNVGNLSWGHNEETCETGSAYQCSGCKFNVGRKCHAHKLCCYKSRFCEHCIEAKAQEFIDALDDPARVRKFERYQAVVEELLVSWMWLGDNGHRYYQLDDSIPDSENPWISRALDVVRENGRKLHLKSSKVLGMTMPGCCGGEVSLIRFLRCLSPETARKLFLRFCWMRNRERFGRGPGYECEWQCCAYPDCGESLPYWCQYPVLGPADAAPTRVYGWQAPRRWYCLMCKRDSEMPLSNGPVLAEKQTKFPWFPKGHAMLVPAGYPPAGVFENGGGNWDEMPLLEAAAVAE
ncbi:hypothetical protein B0T16DRAFT_457480 [Cercophora newfieldiana]|uniref:Uncharacterized protein n=1 Tax=Cercophora newfieldiana TaxID=92897 RepID=A0AA39Y3P3_9PEZI|nr:hypothetical protein B0T16DRAFT_457480 [Cercophora newfieldiana]